MTNTLHWKLVEIVDLLNLKIVIFQWPIEIVDLPNLKKVIFQFAMLVYQRVNHETQDSTIKNRHLTINHTNLSIICRAWTWLKRGVWGFNHHVWDDITWYPTKNGFQHHLWMFIGGFNQQVVSILDTISSKFSMWVWKQGHSIPTNMDPAKSGLHSFKKIDVLRVYV
jgi:hypothetical protein